MKLQRRLLIFITLTLISSCGGGDGSENTLEPDEVNGAYSFTEFLYAKNNEDRAIDLSSNIGKNGKISSIVPKSSAECFKLKNSTTIIASDVSNSLCTAEVYFDSNKKKGMVSISSTDGSNENDSFDIISKTVISNNSLTVNMADELGSDFPSGFILDSELVVIGSANVISDPISNTIQVTAGDKDDITKIVYIYKSLTSDKTIQGLLLVSNSLRANNIPTAGSYQISGSVNEEILVDISTLINDIDSEDKLQLIDLYSLSNYEYIKIEDSTNLENTRFFFKPEKEGIFDVFYVVSDHRGGIASNVIRFDINGYASFKPIYVDSLGNMFFPPKLVSDVQGIYDYTSVISENGDFGPKGLKFPSFSNEQALKYCHQQGLALPNLSQISELYKQEQIKEPINTIYLADNWPSTLKYAAIDGNYDLQNGKESADTDGYYYVSCIGLTLKSLEIPTSIISEQTKDTSLYAVGHYSDNSSSVYQKSLYWEISGGDDGIATIDSTTGLLHILGEGIIEVTATTSEGISTTSSVRILSNLLSTENGSFNGFDSTFNSSGSCFTSYDSYNTKNYFFGAKLSDKGVDMDTNPSSDDAELANNFYDIVRDKIGIYDSGCLEYPNDNGYFKMYSMGRSWSTEYDTRQQNGVSSSFFVKHDFLNGLDLSKTLTFVVFYDAILNVNEINETLDIKGSDTPMTGINATSEFHRAKTITVDARLYAMKSGIPYSSFFAQLGVTFNLSNRSAVFSHNFNLPGSNKNVIIFRDDLSRASLEKLNGDLYKLHVESVFEYNNNLQTTYPIDDLLQIQTEYTARPSYEPNSYLRDGMYTSLSTRLDNIAIGFYEGY
ncbi:TPA: hypothetical protein ACX6PV_001227 [Photobacterium damselae]